jgi:cephalosporin-C deacetylase-like acetyl esterase
MQNGEVTLKEGRATVTGSLAEPGFLQCKAGYKTDKDKDKGSVRGIGSAAIDPQLIKPSLPVPDDFDAFWAGKRKLLAAVPVNATMKAVTPAPPGIDLFDVQADAIGDKPMRGLYARPTGAKPKSLPAIITLEGAGVYATRREPWLLAMAKEGFLSLEINAHGLPNDQPAAFYLALERGDLKDYEMMGRNSRETCYFLNMYLRAQRAVDFLTSQPEWDGKILISNGTSQGGAQAIFLAATEPRVTFLMAAVPAMCDHSGMVAGRVPGWPRLVPFAADGKPDPAVLETSRYFDSVNFCSRLRVPCLFAVGFLDQVSPPTTIYAAYNSVPSEKEIYPSPLSPHRLDPVMWPEIKRRLLLHK